MGPARRAHGGQPPPPAPAFPRTHKLDAGGADVVTGRQLLLANRDVRLSYAVADRPSPLYRNAAGDECVYVESGRAVVETVFGPLAVAAGRLRRSCPRRRPIAGSPSGVLRALVIEARARATSGRPGATSRRPASSWSRPRTASVTSVARRSCRPSRAWTGRRRSSSATAGGGTRYVFSHHPFDVVGWDGCLYPYAFNIADFEPMVGRVHLPPPVHQTFEGPGFVVCSFCPRPFDFDPAAVPVPYNHANVDSDEVLFYVGGDFMSRRGAGIEVGLGHAAPGRVRARSPAGVGRGVARPAGDRRVGRHGRHLPAAARSGPAARGRRGHRLRLELETTGSPTEPGRPTSAVVTLCAHARSAARSGPVRDGRGALDPRRHHRRVGYRVARRHRGQRGPADHRPAFRRRRVGAAVGHHRLPDHPGGADPARGLARRPVRAANGSS